MSEKPTPGIYHALVDQELRDWLDQVPERRFVLEKLEAEEQPARFAAFIARWAQQALLELHKPGERLELANRLMALLAGEKGQDHLARHRLVLDNESVLAEIKPPDCGTENLPRPMTSIVESSLFTGAPREPQLVQELLMEMHSADAVDILVSFIKWSGLRLLMSGFERLRERRVPVRLITTSYMGASDEQAVAWLAGLPNVEVRISYDTNRTRLHAKAYHFKRNSGFSTAYIGSSNMSSAAMTAGLEWNLKVTAQDLPRILEKFSAEFETYWHGPEFERLDPTDTERLRKAIASSRSGDSPKAVFFDLRPHPFQERILETLAREREVHHHARNLVIAATGTGKTIIAAFDFLRFYHQKNKQARLLFIAHREEILNQALYCFRNVLRDPNFGERLVGSYSAGRMDHLFCSVQMAVSRKIWEQVGRDYYEYIVIDEVHHGAAASYRPLFEHFSPEILLGLTATPERMDGGNVAADFGNRFAAEIRLPEALEEKLLCPFHYFGVADPVAIDADSFWKNGRYDNSELENVYTGAHVLARQRLQAIFDALDRYEKDHRELKGVGFCVSIKHAQYMAEMFTTRGIPAGAFVSGVSDEACRDMLEDLRSGRLSFLFTVDKLSEGIDVPEMNIVLFLRPTESLTVFLQQLGRGLRHAPGKDCLTVLDFVGQVHRRYRMDTKFKALLPGHRYEIGHEVERGFPHLPPGCSIQLDRLSREYVMKNIRENMKNFGIQVKEQLQTFVSEAGEELTFGNFIRHHEVDPLRLLREDSWSGWKAKAQLVPMPADPDLERLKKSLMRAACISGPEEIARLREVIVALSEKKLDLALASAGNHVNLVHYRMWGQKGEDAGFDTWRDSLKKLSDNPSILNDLIEILDWAKDATLLSGKTQPLPFASSLELHALYGSRDIQAALGTATLKSAGQTGVGVLPFHEKKAYALLITFQKTEKEFSPSTMYADYPISRELLHWESQSGTSQNSKAGQNLIHHLERGYTILIFARDQKKMSTQDITAPFQYLGTADRVSYEGERPIKMVWRLHVPMPVEMFEENRRGG